MSQARLDRLMAISYIPKLQTKMDFYENCRYDSAICLKLDWIGWWESAKSRSSRLRRTSMSIVVTAHQVITQLACINNISLNTLCHICIMESIFLWSSKDKGLSKHDTISFVICLVWAWEIHHPNTIWRIFQMIHISVKHQIPKFPTIPQWNGSISPHTNFFI